MTWVWMGGDDLDVDGPGSQGWRWAGREIVE